MRVKRLRLTNWKNFLKVDVELQSRAFLIGPNASGKSNLLDALRFLKEVAESGLQSAVVDRRRGISQIRSLHARRQPTVCVEVLVDLDDGADWRYRLELGQDNNRRPVVRHEAVWRSDDLVMERPNSDDHQDESLLTQTHLEQVSRNRSFRAMRDFLARVSYLHIVPQLIREPERSVGKTRDPYGGDFLEQVAGANPKTLESRFGKIVTALKVAVPSLKKIELKRDNRGVPHLQGLFEHWRKDAGWQNEEQFSDGTLRLLGLLWVLLDGVHPLLLEEPELSLHPAVIQHLPAIMARINRKSGRQVLVSTHSATLLDDPGIAADEVILLVPEAEGTRVFVAASDSRISDLVSAGVSLADAVLPYTAPHGAQQLALFGS